jgi:hypothetical protein
LHKNVITQLEDFLFDKYKVNWQNRMFSQNVGNKLRTYKLFKEVFETEMYLSKNISSRYRSAFAKFRCGVAPLRIETGRYENKNVNERVCFICRDQIEDEKHVLLDCPLYADLRESLFKVILHQFCVTRTFFPENSIWNTAVPLLRYSCMFQVEICSQQLEICKSVCLFIVLAIIVETD